MGKVLSLKAGRVRADVRELFENFSGSYWDKMIEWKIGHDMLTLPHRFAWIFEEIEPEKFEVGEG